MYPGNNPDGLSQNDFYFSRSFWQQVRISLSNTGSGKTAPLQASFLKFRKCTHSATDDRLHTNSKRTGSGKKLCVYFATKTNHIALLFNYHSLVIIRISFKSFASSGKSSRLLVYFYSGQMQLLKVNASQICQKVFKQPFGCPNNSSVISEILTHHTLLPSCCDLQHQFISSCVCLDTGC